MKIYTDIHTYIYIIQFATTLRMEMSTESEKRTLTFGLVSSVMMPATGNCTGSSPWSGRGDV